MPSLFRKFTKSFKSGEKGFTLIELLIVIAILGILASVPIPQLSKFIGQSKIAAANAELGLVKTAIGAGMADKWQPTLTGGTLSSSSDITIVSGEATVGNYIQGGYVALLGSYTIDNNGNITAATYTGGGTFSPTLQKFQ